MWIFFVALCSTLSYLSVYQPHIFSRNILPLRFAHSKLILFVITLSISIFWIGYNLPLEQNSILLLSIELILVQIACIDGYSKIIPNRLLLVLLVLLSIHLPFDSNNPDWIIISVLGISIVGIQLIVQQVLARNLVGWGDIKLLLVLTLLFQQQLILIVGASFIIAGTAALLLITMDKRYLRVTIPLSPFFVMSTLARSEIQQLTENLLLNAV